MRRDPERALTLEPGRTALALRGLQNLDSCYPFIERRRPLRTRRRRPQLPGLGRRAFSWFRAQLSGSHRRARPASIRGTLSA